MRGCRVLCGSSSVGSGTAACSDAGAVCLLHDHKQACPAQLPRAELVPSAGDLSRNRTVGLRLGKGEKLADITASMKAVAEGILTAQSAHALAAKLGIESPIIEGIYRVRCQSKCSFAPLHSCELDPPDG